MALAGNSDAVRLRARYVFAIWTALGVFNCMEMWLSYAFDGRQVTWLQVAVATLPRTWIWALLTPIVFTVSARFPVRAGMPARSVLAHVSTWLGCLTIHAFANTVNRFGDGARNESFGVYFAHGFLLWIPSTLVLYCATAGVAQWMLSTQRVRRHEREQAEMSGQLATAQLTALRMQLHPHFLFNTLNTIAILIRESDTATAERLVTQLGDVLRRVLRTTHANETTLGEEIAFLRSYLEIEQLRFGSRLRVHWDVDEQLLGATVPVLLLQPLVENALRHGIAHAVDGGTVEIGASRDGGEMELWVTNSRPEIERAHPVPPNPGCGVGLLNTRRRLEQLYPERSKLVLRREPNGDTRANVSMPYLPWPAGNADERGAPESEAALVSSK
jgi:two-component system LytT family sensor kinase